MGIKDIELTRDETEIVINKWKNQDWATRHISLNRGHWEDITPLVAHASSQKTLQAVIEYFEGTCDHTKLQLRRTCYKCYKELKSLLDGEV